MLQQAAQQERGALGAFGFDQRVQRLDPLARLQRIDVGIMRIADGFRDRRVHERTLLYLSEAVPPPRERSRTRRPRRRAQPGRYCPFRETSARRFEIEIELEHIHTRLAEEAELSAF